MKPSILTLACLLWPALAGADTIYKYVDDQGNVTYSNQPIRGSKVIVMDPAPPAPPPAPPGTGEGASPPPTPGQPRNSNASKPRQSTPANFPRVDDETQRKRDVARRQILEEELKSEERFLAEAKQALKEGEATRLGNERNYQKYLDRVQGLKDTVTQHERNVQAIRKELGNLGR